MNWSDLSMSQRSELIQIYLKNGVTSLDEMKKHYNSFAEGGSTDIPPERFFGIATPEVTDNNIYYSRNSLLPEVKVVAKGDPRKVNNDYYKAHAAERAALQDRVATRTDYKALNPTNILEYTPVIGDALDAANIINDASNKNYLSAGIGAGMFLLPNIIEKPLKGLKTIPIALSHNISNNNLRNSLLGRNKSLLNPSMGLGHMKYNSNINGRTALFFNKELLQEYPNQAYLGDGNTPMVFDFFDDNQLDLISRMSGRKINQIMKSKTGIPLSKLGAGEQIPYEEALQIARENRAKDDLVNTYNEIKFDGLIPINRAGYAFTDSENIANMLTRRGIVNNFDFYESNPKAYSSYKTFLDDIVFENPDYVFKDGGKIFIKPENRGKFTALKKRTGHSASWFKEHGTPAQKKMAVFALNAKKWRK